MKRFLVVSLLSLPLLLGTVPLAFAQTTTLTPDQQIQQAANQAAAENTAAIGGQGVQAPTPDFPTANNITVTQPVIDAQGNITNGATTEVTSTGNAVPAAAAPAPNANASNSSPDFTKDPIGYLMFQLVSIFAWFVGIAGIALNVAAYYSIVRMGYLVGQLSALQVAWSTFRDIGNLLILFGFIFFGVSTMLDNAGYNQKKALIMLVLVAVAINFSSLFARIIIDVGNVIGIQFYKAFNGGAVPTGLPTSNGIANVFMSSLKLTTIYNNPSYSGTKEIYIGFLAIILFIVVAFVFFSIAFIFIARFVVLVFLITISPLAFAALVIPKYEDQFKRWLGMLVNNTMVAPVMLLLLLVSTRIVTSPTFTNLIPGGDGTSWGAFANDPSGNGALGGVNLLIVFMLACAFYIASLIAAKQIGAFGASAATNLTGKMMLGGVGVAGRNTIGRTSYALSKGLRKTAFARTTFGRMTVQAFDKGAKASFDPRGAKIVQTATKTAGIDAGKAQAGGFAKRVKENVDAHVAYANSLKGDRTAEEEKARVEAVKKADEARKAHEATTQTRNKVVDERRIEEEKIAEATSKKTETEAKATEAQKAYEDAQKVQQQAVAARQAAEARLADVKNRGSGAGSALAESELATARRNEEEAATKAKTATEAHNTASAAHKEVTTTISNSEKIIQASDKKLAQANAQFAETQAALDKAVGNANTISKKLEGTITDSQAQADYGRRVEKASFLNVYYGPHAAKKEAAAKIIKESGKDSAERDRDKLIAALEKAGKAAEKKDDSGEAGH